MLQTQVGKHDMFPHTDAADDSLSDTSGAEKYGYFFYSFFPYSPIYILCGW